MSVPTSPNASRSRDGSIEESQSQEDQTAAEPLDNQQELQEPSAVEEPVNASEEAKTEAMTVNGFSQEDQTTAEPLDNQQELQEPSAVEEPVNASEEAKTEAMTVNGFSQEDQTTAEPLDNQQKLQEPSAVEEPLKASEEAISFLSSIVPQTDSKCLRFPDNLVTESDEGRLLGEFKVAVDSTRFHDQQCYLIHASSQGEVDGVPCGCSIVSHVSESLDTLQQHRHEYVKLEHDAIDRKTILTRTNDGYVVTKIFTRGETVENTSHTIPLDSMKGFISEGSNILLQRIYILQGLTQELRFLSFDSEANICPVIYRSLQERSQTVAGKEFLVYGIERTILSDVDLPTTWQSYFFHDGHLSNRVQVGSPVIMRLRTMPALRQKEPVLPKPSFPKKELDLEEDEELYSRYLDRKEQLKNDHGVYLRHHPELQALLADFLQFLLLVRPDDVIAFAADYFADFSVHMRAVSPPFLASARPPRFPSLHTNPRIEALRALPI